MARVTEEERNAEGICLSVTDAQAATLRRMRQHTRTPTLGFARQRRTDGSRAVTDEFGHMIGNLDAEGFAVELRDHRWSRIDEPYDPR